MKLINKQLNTIITMASLLVLANNVWAFDSGSTGADGAFSPTASQTLQLPPNGIFNFTTVNIPSGVTVTFIPNAINTPVTLLASGDVLIEGSINLNGQNGSSIEQNNTGRSPFEKVPGGPGGYAGGTAGGISQAGSNGFGPGGGPRGIFADCSGGSGTFASRGRNSCSTVSASTYGNSSLLPLIGGSGGGSSRRTNRPSASGGGGGGAILIASSTTLTLRGSIIADGGIGGQMVSADGGAGSGGAIRLVATTLIGNGILRAKGGDGGGGLGRIRAEAESLPSFNPSANPTLLFDFPRPVSLAGIPSLRITGVNGVTVPAFPTGIDDVTLPADITNPVAINFSGINIPLTTTVTVKMTPAQGANVSATSTPLSGTEASSTASASITLPQGASTLSATVSYSVTIQQATVLAKFTNGEKVARVEITASHGQSMTKLVTVSGKHFDIPTTQIAMN